MGVHKYYKRNPRTGKRDILVRNAWRIIIELPPVEFHDDGTPKRNQQSKVFYGSWRDANSYYNELCLERDRGKWVPFNKKETLSQFADRYFSEVRAIRNPKYNSLKSWLSCIAWVYRTEYGIANIPVAEVTSGQLTQAVQVMINNKLKSGTIRQYINSLGLIFEWGIAQRHFYFNPIKQLTLPDPVPSNEPALWTREQLIYVLNELDARDSKARGSKTKSGRYSVSRARGSLKHVFWIQIFTGLRNGEVHGLKWADVDFANHMMTVNHQRVRQYKRYGKIGNNEDALMSPKYTSGGRMVPMSEGLENYLQNIYYEQMKLRHESPENWPHDMSDTYVLSTDNGDTYVPGYAQDYWNKFLKELDVPHQRPHLLRHHYATLLHEMGYDMYEASRILGHKHPDTSMSIYMHWKPSPDDKRIQELDTLLYTNTLNQSNE